MTYDQTLARLGALAGLLDKEAELERQWRKALARLARAILRG